MNSLLPVLVDKIPSYVRENFPNFVSFMSDYLRFLEQDTEFLGIIESWQNNNEPSLNVEPYIQAILRDFGFESENNLAVRESLLLASLKDFYISRGSVASFKYIFRALFDADVDIQYPREQLLVPSAASYATRHFIYTTASNYQSVLFQSILRAVADDGGYIIGSISKLRIAIENITIVYGNNLPYLRIEILEPNHEFDLLDIIQITVNEQTVFETIYPILSVNISAAGAGYKVGDRLLVSGANLHGSGKVSSISTGSVDSMSISSAGTGYAIGDLILATTLDHGFGFSGSVTAVNGSGGITAVRINQKGYNYSLLPDLVINSALGTGGLIAAHSSSIGSVQSVVIEEPFVDFSSVGCTIESLTGTGCSLSSGKMTRWSPKGWLDKKGFIGIASTLIDSYKNQQYSYSIISSIPYDQYKDFVADTLHPAGYVAGGILEISAAINLSLNNESTIGSNSVTYVYDAVLGWTWTADYEMATIESPVLAAVLSDMSLDPLVDDTDDIILYTRP